jgi:hypothetical protein
MASDLTPYFGNITLRWLNNQADMPSRPTTLFLGLFNGNPKTTGTEVGASVKSAGKRQSITFAALASGALHLLTSNIDVDWGLSETGPVNISHFALFDDASAGHMYASRAVAGGPITVAIGSSVKFLSGSVTFNIGADS